MEGVRTIPYKCVCVCVCACMHACECVRVNEEIVLS